MSRTLVPLPRETYWALVDGVEESKRRVSVITRVESDRVELVYGQSRSGQGREIVVAPESLEGRRLRLTITTYFRRSNVALVAHSRLKEKIGQCPSSLFLELEALAEEARRQGVVVDMLRRRSGSD